MGIKSAEKNRKDVKFTWQIRRYYRHVKYSQLVSRYAPWICCNALVNPVSVQGEAFSLGSLVTANDLVRLWQRLFLASWTNRSERIAAMSTNGEPESCNANVVVFMFPSCLWDFLEGLDTLIPNLTSCPRFWYPHLHPTKFAARCAMCDALRRLWPPIFWWLDLERLWTWPNPKPSLWGGGHLRSKQFWCCTSWCTSWCKWRRLYDVCIKVFQAFLENHLHWDSVSLTHESHNITFHPFPQCMSFHLHLHPNGISSLPLWKAKKNTNEKSLANSPRGSNSLGIQLDPCQSVPRWPAARPRSPTLTQAMS